MSVGLLAVVDDILSAAIKASAKSAAVVIDDAAVTPQYVRGISPARELPVVAKIALGSIANKTVLIIPAALALTAFAPWVLPYLLIVGGAFLCYEGAEKVGEWMRLVPVHADDGPRDESRLVWGAIRTDLILSAEIMLISLANLDEGMSLPMTLGVLVVIALAMTLIVYGSVALLVKIDDVGLHMATSRGSRSVRHAGVRIVRSMPAVFRVIGVVGAIAMLWVGGHLVIVNLGETLWAFPADLLHALELALAPLGGVVVWIVDTALSAVVGLAVGAVILAVIAIVRRVFARSPRTPDHAAH